jgi:adenylosuccinate lyase
MAAVKQGVGREEAHEVIKEHAVAAALGTREGKPNKMLEALAEDSRIPLSLDELRALISTPLEFTGDAHAQTQRVIDRIGAITTVHATAAKYRPGSIR